MAALYIMVAEKENSLWYNAGRNLGSLPEVRLLLQGQDFANRATVVHTESLNVWVSAGNVPGEAIGVTLGSILFNQLTQNKLRQQQKR